MSELLLKKQKIAIAVGLLELFILEKKKTKRRIWTKMWLLKRQQYSHMNMLRELRVTEPKDFQNYLRMDNTAFSLLLNMVRHKIEKQDTKMRQSISAEERLVATLRFLATGRNYEDLKFSTIISPQLLGQLIPETCREIYNVLSKDYLKVSKSVYFNIQRNRYLHS